MVQLGSYIHRNLYESGYPISKFLRGNAINITWTLSNYHRNWIYLLSYRWERSGSERRYQLCDSLPASAYNSTQRLPSRKVFAGLAQQIYTHSLQPAFVTMKVNDSLDILGTGSLLFASHCVSDNLALSKQVVLHNYYQQRANVKNNILSFRFQNWL